MKFTKKAFPPRAFFTMYRRDFVFSIIGLLSLLVVVTCAVPDDKTTGHGNAVTHFEKLDKQIDAQLVSSDRFEMSSKNIDTILSSYFAQQDMLNGLTGHHLLKFRFHEKMATVFLQVGLLEEAGSNYRKAIEQFEQLDQALQSQELPKNIGAIGTYSGLLVELNQLDSATVFYSKAITLTKGWREENGLFPSAMNNMGIHLNENLDQPLEALQYFNKAQKILRGYENTQHLGGFEGSIRDNIANALLATNQFEEALTLFTINHAYFSPENKTIDTDYYRWIRAALQMAETQIKVENTSTTAALLNEVDSLLSTIDFKENSRLRIRYYDVLRQLHLFNNEFESGYAVLKKGSFLEDSIQNAQTSLQQSWVSQMKHIGYQKTRQNFDAREVRLKSQRQKELYGLLLVILIATLVLFILISGYQYHTKRLALLRKSKTASEQREKVLALQNYLIDRKTQIKKRDLMDLALSAIQNRDWLTDLKALLMRYKKSKGRGRSKKLKELSMFLNMKTLYNEKAKFFYEHMDQINGEFFKVLGEKFPNLSKSEIKLCSLVRMGLDIQAIAHLENVHQKTVYQQRYKLKKSLGLEEDHDLDVFINGI